MKNDAKADLPKVELATKDWALKELMDTERRFEKAFHEQTQFLSRRTDELKSDLSEVRSDMAAQTRWMVGLMLTMTIVIIVAVLFK
ncbi:MAG: hypothetical protein AAF228_06115 [Pseudomonadota bacterium]